MLPDAVPRSWYHDALPVSRLKWSLQAIRTSTKLLSKPPAIAAENTLKWGSRSALCAILVPIQSGKENATCSAGTPPKDVTD